MADSSFEALVQKYLTSSLSTAEKEQFKAQLSHPDNRALLQQMIDAHLADRTFEDGENTTVRNRIFEKLMAGVNEDVAAPARIKTVNWLRVAAAACILLLLGSGAYLYFHRSSRLPGPPVSSTRPADILPGGNKAILTLSNGEKIVLDSAHNGLLASQGNSNIMKMSNGLLAYHAQASGKTRQTEVEYNTLTIPAGGQYRLMLPDSTEVWLNAVSSIRFPTRFVGKERIVEITGEAYFEVKHNAGMPFKVKVGNEVVEDLGTRFNINAYPDEPATKITLLEGSVKVTDHAATRANPQTLILKPGQQARISKDEQMSLVKDVDIDEVIAWKKGEFLFDNASIYDIMRRLSRWYNVKVHYKDSLAVFVNGSISRDVPVSEVFTILAQTGEVHFKINEKEIEVSK